MNASSSPSTAASAVTTGTPRARRGAAAVIAQYIQDLSRPSEAASPLACTAAA